MPLGKEPSPARTPQAQMPSKGVVIGVLIVIFLLIVFVFWMYAGSSSQTAAPAPAGSGPTPASPAAQGASAPAASSYPGGFTEGAILRCPTDGSIYQLQNGAKRGFPNMTVYRKYNSPPYTNVDCGTLAQIPNGPAMS